MPKMKLSIVIPVYNSEKIIEELYLEINKALKKEVVYFEIIMVDDHSTDNSYERMIKLHKKNKNIKIIKLLRNFGQHNAIMCGFNFTEGDYIITMDDDLQNPPKEIMRLFNEAKKGYDLVVGIPVQKKHRLIRNILSKLITFLNNRILGIDKRFERSNFRIYSKELVKNIITIKSGYCYLPAFINHFISYDRVSTIGVKHNESKINKTRYNLFKLLKLTSNLIINYSSLPLRLIAVIGFITSFFSIIYGIYTIIMKLFINPDLVAGWPSIIVLTSFIGGLILFSLGVIGEYLKRIIKEISFSEQYIIEEKRIN